MRFRAVWRWLCSCSYSYLRSCSFAHPYLLAEARNCAAAAAAAIVLVVVGYPALVRAQAPVTAVAPHYEFEISAPEDIKVQVRRQTLIGRWRTRPEYQPDQFDALYARLREEVETILRANGYFDFKLELSGTPQKVSVLVDAGARTTVNKVDFQLTGTVTGFPEIERQVRLRWLLPEGTFYTASNWEGSKKQILDALRQRGFLRAKLVESRAAVDVVNTTVGLTVTLDSGPRLAFGNVVVTGLSRYDQGLVENLRPFGRGNPYDFDLLLLYQTRLRDSGYFSAVYVLPDQAKLDADPNANLVDLRVEVTERQTKRLVTGIGYSTDQGPRAQIGLQHRDLFDTGSLLDSGLIVEAQRQRLFANVRTPTSPTGHHWAYGGRIENQDIEGERVQRQTVYVGRGKQLNVLDSFTSLQYQTERNSVESAPGVRTETYRRALSLGYSWNYRVLDSRLDPRVGYTVSAQFSGAAKSLGSTASFGRIYTRAMRFEPIDRDTPSKSGIFIGLLEVGAVITNDRDGIPSENLFRAGGSQSIRGYSYQSIGLPNGNAVVGGRVLGLVSLEYQHPVASTLSLAGFVDSGNAVDRIADFKWLTGYGVGVRWRTAIGPINLDIAHGDKWRLHFSVGYAF
jgi:translocation and assembly module TamA